MKKYLLVFLIFTVVLTVGCRTKPADDGKPVITVTILPYQYFAEQLAGDHFTINVLVPPGVSHHNYDPTPRQLQEFEKSRALFIIGHLGFEKAWVPKMKSNSCLVIPASASFLSKVFARCSYESNRSSFVVVE